MNSKSNENPPRKKLSYEDKDELETTLEKTKMDHFEPKEIVPGQLTSIEQIEHNEFMGEKVVPFEKATADQRVNEIFERANESKSKINPTEAEKIKDLKRSITDKLIEKALKEKDDGSERLHTEKIVEKQSSGIKTFATKLMASLGLLFAGNAAKAESAETLFRDSTGTGKEKTVDNKSSKESVDVDNKLRADYNKYMDYLDSLNVRGSTELDHNGLGMKLLERYENEHPGTSFTTETVDDTQVSFQKYRQWVIDEVKAGRAAFGPGTTEENFMKDLSEADNWVGSKTSKFKFPTATLTNVDKTAINTAIVGAKSVRTKDLLEGTIDDVSDKVGKVTDVEKTFSTRKIK